MIFFLILLVIFLRDSKSRKIKKRRIVIVVEIIKISLIPSKNLKWSVRYNRREENNWGDEQKKKYKDWFKEIQLKLIPKFGMKFNSLSKNHKN